MPWQIGVKKKNNAHEAFMSLQICPRNAKKGLIWQKKYKKVELGMMTYSTITYGETLHYSFSIPPLRASQLPPRPSEALQAASEALPAASEAFPAANEAVSVAFETLSAADEALLTAYETLSVLAIP